jgi:hypothetical protein
MIAAVLLLALQIQTGEIREQTPAKFEIAFKYPKLANAEPFNAAVRQTVNPLVEQFRHESRLPGVPDAPGYLHGSYTADTLKTGIVSVLFEWETYTPGAAHPAHGMSSINYDAHADRILPLSGLFCPGVD